MGTAGQRSKLYRHDGTMIISKMVAVRLTKAQDAIARDQLSKLHALWNIYIEQQQIWLDNGDGWLRPYMFSKLVYPSILELYPWLDSLSSKAWRQMTEDCFDSILQQMKNRRSLRFRSRKRDPVHSFYFIRNGIRFTDDSHIWIPILHSIKLKEKGYILESDIQYILSGRIVLKHDKWYLRVVLEVPLDYFDSENAATFPSGIGIDLGIKTMITVATDTESFPFVMQSNTVNPAFDSYSQNLYQKIDRLNAVISHKIACNKKYLGYTGHNPKIKKEDVPAIYHSKSIMKLRNRATRYYEMLSNHKYDSMKKAASALARTKPMFICMEDIDSVELLERRGNHVLRRSNQRACYGYFRKFIKWRCSVHNVPIYEVPAYWPSSQICSVCGNIKTGRQKMRLNMREYHCKSCGNSMDRDANAAKNILWWGYHYGKDTDLGYEVR